MFSIAHLVTRCLTCRLDDKDTSNHWIVTNLVIGILYLGLAAAGYGIYHGQ